MGLRQELSKTLIPLRTLRPSLRDAARWRKPLAEKAVRFFLLLRKCHNIYSGYVGVKLMTEDKNRMEDQLIDMRLAVSALLETVTHHQHNFETIQRNFETMQRNFESTNSRIDTIFTEIREIRSDMLQMQSEVRGLQTENRRILDILQNRNPEDDSLA